MGISPNLLKSTFFYGLGNVLPQVIGFFLIPLYTIYLSPTDYGIVDLAASISGFLTPLMRLGVPGAVTRFYFDFKDEKQLFNNYVTSIYYLLLFASCSIGLVFVGVYLLWANHVVPELLFYPYVILVVLTSVFSSNSDLQRRLIVARGQATFSAKLTTIFSLISIGLTLLLVIVFKMSAVGVILAQSITAFIFFIHAQYYLKLNLVGKVSVELVKESMKYGVGLLPHHLFVAFAPLLSKFVLARYDSVASLGILAIAIRFILPLEVIYNAFIPSFHPLYFEKRKVDSLESTQNLVHLQRQIIAITILIYILYSLFVPRVIPFIVDDRYKEAAAFISILGLGFVGKMFYANFIVEIFYLKHTKWVSITTLLGLSVTILLSFLMVSYGPKGIAYANSAGFLIWAIIAYLLSRWLNSPINNNRYILVCVVILILSFVLIELVNISFLLKLLLLLPFCLWLLSKAHLLQLVKNFFNKKSS